jgi:hypothetical protein
MKNVQANNILQILTQKMQVHTKARAKKIPTKLHQTPQGIITKL